jgi:hypothetical protein
MMEQNQTVGRHRATYDRSSMGSVFMVTLALAMLFYFRPFLASRRVLALEGRRSSPATRRLKAQAPAPNWFDSIGVLEPAREYPPGKSCLLIHPSCLGRRRFIYELLT